MPIKSKGSSRLLWVLGCFLVMHCTGQAAQHKSELSAAARGNVYSDVSSFAAELHRLKDAVGRKNETSEEIALIRRQLPSRWDVDTREGHYSVSTEPLRSLLIDAEKEKNSSKLAAKTAEATGWLLDLADQVNGYAAAQASNTENARPSLERILSRREFGGLRGPTEWDLFRQRIKNWIQNLLVRMFGRLVRHPIGARVLFWFLIFAAVAWMAVALFRYWTRRAALEELEVPDAVAFSRTWQEWVYAAREAATRGDFREAVHSAYWAGICYLEDSGVVRKDRTRTPREYLRMISDSAQPTAAGHEIREALSALTAGLEQVWYGRRAASNRDFADALHNVKALGCQLP
jgi:hypothetical protein